MPQVFFWGLDDDMHCHWWPHLDHECMKEAYVVHMDYKELLRRLPAGGGEPGPSNTLQLSAGGGSRRLLEQHRSESSSGGPALASVLTAALKQPDPHVLFLSAVPDLSAPWPQGQPAAGVDTAADQRFLKWNETCIYMRDVSRGPWSDDGKRP